MVFVVFFHPYVWSSFIYNSFYGFLSSMIISVVFFYPRWFVWSFINDDLWDLLLSTMVCVVFFHPRCFFWFSSIHDSFWDLFSIHNDLCGHFSIHDGFCGLLPSMMIYEVFSIFICCLIVIIHPGIPPSLNIHTLIYPPTSLELDSPTIYFSYTKITDVELNGINNCSEILWPRLCTERKF